MSLAVTQLCGFGVGASSRPASISYVSKNETTSAGTTGTFNTQNIGTASSDRYVLVTASTLENNTGPGGNLTCTINGNSAASIVGVEASIHNDLNYYALSYIFGLLVTSGTTADIVLTCNKSCYGFGIGVFSATSLLSTTPTNTYTSQADPGAASVNVSAGGILLGTSTCYQSSSPTFAWSNLTERYDAVVRSPFSHTGASDAFASSQSSLSVSATATGGSQYSIASVFAAFR